jgi:phenylalanine-4-hydroxylase
MSSDPFTRSGLRPEQIPADYVVDQRFETYTAADHDTWSRLHRRQSELLRGRVCDEFFAGLAALGIEADGIPNFRDIIHRQKLAAWWLVRALLASAPKMVRPRPCAARSRLL